ncbi:MAG: AsmA family protein, partial [Fibrobacter sp.]|nr:AsmA family protein [Fibrobacter sp.]
MKSAGKIVGISIVILLLLVLITGGVLWVLFPAEKVKTMVISEVEKELGRKVAVEKASFSIFPFLGVSLSGLEISNTTRSGFSEQSFVKIDNLLVSIRLMSILKQTPQISGIVLKNPKIILETNTDGSFNYEDFAFLKNSDTTKKDTLKEQKSSGTLPVLALPVALDKFAIENGEFTYIDRKNKQTVHIGTINQQIKSSLDKKLQDIKTSGELVLSNVSVKTKEINKPLTDLTIQINHDIGADLTSGKVIVQKVGLSLQKVSVTISGSINNVLSAPHYDLKIVSDDIAIKDLLKEIPVELVPELAKLDASGTAKIDLAVKGEFKEKGSLPVAGTIAFSNGLIKYKELPKALSNITTTISFTDNSADIHETKLRFGDNPIEFRVKIVNFSKPVIDMTMSASVNLLDMKDLITLPPGASLSGSIQTSFTAKGEVDPSNPEKLDVNGVANLKDVAVLWPPLVKPAVVNGTFTLSSEAIGENLSVVTGQSSLKMTASVKNYLTLILGGNGKKPPRPTAEFAINSPMINVDEILPPSGNNKKETAGAGPEVSKAPESVPVVVPPPGIDLEGTITAGRILYMGVTMNNLSVRVKAKNDISDVFIKTGYSGGVITDKIHADLRNMKKVSFTNSISVSNVEINDLMICASNFIK